jgi:agmatinase
MRFWSQHLTPYSEDRTPLRGMRICDLGDMQVQDIPQDFDRVRERVAALPCLPVLLGGDHSVTIPIFEGQRRKHAGKRLGVLWLDAHPDLCDTYTGSRLSHACVLRRGLEAGIDADDVCMVGLRSWEEQEVDLVENGGLHVYSAADVERRGVNAVSAEVRAVLRRCDAVHISLDIDCLDPAFAPGTGIPDAGGLSTRQVITLLQALEGLPLVGLDIVEVAPPLDPSEATVFAALKLMMEFVAVIARSKH